MKAIVLAAGKGTRLESEKADLPKALRQLRGKPLIGYVLDNLDFIAPRDIVIVIGYMGDKVKEALGGEYRYVEQELPYNGTGKATECARKVLGDLDEPVLVCYCDMPFLSRDTYRLMFETHISTGAGNTLLAGIVDPPPPYGRLIRDAQGRLVDIVEESAATPEQRRIAEVNIGIQVLDGARMWDWLAQLTDDNPKREFYLTGLAGILAREGVRQEVVLLQNPVEMMGVNTMEDLHAAEREVDRMAGNR